MDMLNDFLLLWFVLLHSRIPDSSSPTCRRLLFLLWRAYNAMEGNVDSGVLQIFACGVWDLGIFFAESWALESGIQFKESGIPLTRGIRNPGKFH